MIKAFFKDSAVYLVPSMLMYGANFFLLPLYTRILSPADYGALDMLRVFEAIIFLVVALEIVQGHGRYYMDETDPTKKVEYVSTALIFTVFCYSCFFVLCSYFSRPLSEMLFGNVGFENVFQLGVIYISVGGVLLFLNTQLRYELRAKDYAIMSVTTFLSTASFSLLFAIFLEFKLRGMVGGILLGNIVGLLVGIWFLKNSIKLVFDLQKLKQMLLFSIPLVPSGAAVFISGYVDRLMINHFLSLEEVGLYGMGFRISAIVSLLLVGFNRALSPLIISNYRKKETPSQIATIFRIFVSVSLVFCLGLTIFAKEILWLLTTPAYYEASKVVIFLVPAILFSQMYIFAPGTSIAKKTIYIMWINIIAAIINAILNWLLIPFVGFEGAALATFMSHLSVFTLKMAVSQRYYFIPFDWLPICFAMIVTALLCVLGRYLMFGELLYIVVKLCLVASIPIVCIWTKLLSREEIATGYANIKQFFMPTGHAK